MPKSLEAGGQVRSGDRKGGRSKVTEGTCGGASWQKNKSSNSYRTRHDDGSRKSRRGAGGMDNKHRSPLLT